MKLLLDRLAKVVLECRQQEGVVKMLKRVKKALEPDRNKWFDITDIRIIAGSVLALIGGWAMVTLATIIF